MVIRCTSLYVCILLSLGSISDALAIDVCPRGLPAEWKAKSEDKWIGCTADRGDRCGGGVDITEAPKGRQICTVKLTLISMLNEKHHVDTSDRKKFGFYGIACGDNSNILRVYTGGRGWINVTRHACFVSDTVSEEELQKAGCILPKKEIYDESEFCREEGNGINLPRLGRMPQ